MAMNKEYARGYHQAEVDIIVRLLESFFPYQSVKRAETKIARIKQLFEKRMARQMEKKFSAKQFEKRMAAAAGSGK